MSPSEWVVSSGSQWYSIVDRGAVDFFMVYGMDGVNAIAQGIPKITVAAIFQKDPWYLMHIPTQQLKPSNQQSTVNTQHSTVNSQHSTLNTQQSTVNSHQSSVNSQHSTLKLFLRKFSTVMRKQSKST